MSAARRYRLVSVPAAWGAASRWRSPMPAIAVTLVDFKPRDAAAFARLAAEATDEVRGTLTSLARIRAVRRGQGRPHRRARRGRARSGGSRGALIRRRDLRRRARGARSQARGAGARVRACRPAADHRLDHIDHPGRRSVGRGRASGTLPQRALAQSGLSRAAGRDVARRRAPIPRSRRGSRRCSKASARCRSCARRGPATSCRASRRSP